MTERTDKPDIHIGNIVYIKGFPYSFETTKAEVDSEPTLDEQGDWCVAVTYRYMMERKHAIVKCIKIVKVRNSRMKLSKPAIITGIILLVVLVLGITITSNYNSLVVGNNKVDNTWSKVETQYQRRFDLIGNLVESVKGSQGQELAVFTAIADGRKQYNAATTSDGKAAAASSIETNVALIPRLQEAYPELKSNAQVTALMNELTGTEGAILVVRNTYNDDVTVWNNTITTFPKNIFAGLFNFDKRTLFKADAGASKAPKVDFSKQ